MIKIFPSLISADLLHLAHAIDQLEPYSDGFHLDVMDDHFVPNLTWGPMFITAIAQWTQKPLFVHLMVENPAQWLKRLELKPHDTLAFHIENKVDHKKLLKQIKENKIKACLAINPKTPVKEIFTYASEIDQVLLMSVDPGFSGQQFLPSSIERIYSLANYRAQHQLSFEIVVDGGINTTTIGDAVSAGADQVCVASAIFSRNDPGENLQQLRNHIRSILRRQNTT